MTYDEAKRALVGIYMEKAQTALVSMRRELAASDFNLAVNRAYYACFYAASAVLLKEGRQFVKHKGVQSAVHQHLIMKMGLPREWGTFYDVAFKARGEADYVVQKKFTQAEAATFADRAEQFVQAIQQLLEK